MKLRAFDISAAIMLSFAAPALAESPPWSYDGDANGQEDWGTLSQAYAPCELGSAQSPVMINRTQLSAMPLLDMHYGKATVRVESNSRDLHLTIADAPKTSIDGVSYRLSEIHFHTPSEHTVRGDFYPLEIQLLHRSDHNEILILSIFAESGEALTALQPMLDKKPAFELDIDALLPSQRGYYAYTGSLTTPPCTEGVQWRVFKKPIQLSASQYKSVAPMMARNARLEQPIYLRTIKETTP